MRPYVYLKAGYMCIRVANVNVTRLRPKRWQRKHHRGHRQIGALVALLSTLGVRMPNG